MSVGRNSRYVTANLYSYNDVLLVDNSRTINTTFSRSAKHTIAQGETLEHISFQYYGDATRWWQIADANASIQNPLLLTPGTVIDIPNPVTGL